MEVNFVGIDVSKTSLDFDCLPDCAPQQFGNDEEGIAALAGLLEGSGVEYKDESHPTKFSLDSIRCK